MAGLQLGVTDGVVVGQAPALQPCGVAVAAAVGCGVAVICGRGKLLGATCWASNVPSAWVSKATRTICPASCSVSHLVSWLNKTVKLATWNDLSSIWDSHPSNSNVTCRPISMINCNSS